MSAAKPAIYLPMSSELASDTIIDLGWHLKRGVVDPLTGFLMDIDHHGWSALGRIEDQDPAHLAENPYTTTVAWDYSVSEVAQDWWWLGDSDY